MKLVKMLYKKFIPVLFISVFFVVLLLCLADMLVNIWGYLSASVPLRTVLSIELFYVPKALWYSLPIAMLFSTAYVLSDFYANNELTAIFSSGVSLFRFSLPLLFLALILSVFMFWLDDRIVVPTYAKKNEMQKQALNRKDSLSNDHIVIMADGGLLIYNAEYYDSELDRLYMLYVVFRNEDRSLDRIIRADSALWNEDHWILSGAAQYTYEDTNVVYSRPSEEYLERLTEVPETFHNNTISVEEVSAHEAKVYIERLERNGLPSAAARADYYKKFSFPFIVLIVVFLAIGLSGKTRKNVLLVSLALSMSAVVLFYIIQMVTMLMAEFELIAPFLGAWFPVMLFVVLSVVLMRYSRT